MRLPVVVLLVAFAAGCVSPSALDVSPARADGAAASIAPLDLSGTACWLGGGHSVLPKYDFILPEPWVPADVLEDVGPTPFYSGVLSNPTSPVPTKGETMGNWHASFVCESWTLRGAAKPGALLGLVGARVEAPPFDEGPPAARHYLVTVVASDDEDVRAAFHEGGVPAMGATHLRESLPGGALRVRMWTQDNGDYDSLFYPKDYGAMEADRFRLWFQRNADGHGHTHADESGPEWRATGEFHPLAIDLVLSGEARHIIAEANGWFSHSGSGHHNGLPGAANTAALLYERVDASVEWGPRPDVVLPAAYVH